MKNHLKIQLLALLLLFNLVAYSQTLTPAFSIKIAFEDKAKHKDTITIGYDPLATNVGVDAVFGEQNSWGVPWDSLFEVRASGGQYAYTTSLGKRVFVKQSPDTVYCYDTAPLPDYMSVSIFGIHLRCKWANFPVTITWDYTQFSGSSCHAQSAIVYNCRTSEPSLFPVHRMNLPFGVFNLQTPYYYAYVAGENGYHSNLFSNVLAPGGGTTSDTVYTFEIRLSSKLDLFNDVILAIQDQTVSELSARVYPNPVRTEVVVSCPEPAWYRLYDLSGKQVYEQYHNAGDNTIDISTVPKGLYLMRLQGKNKFYQQKLVVE